MNRKVDKFFESLKGKKVALCGLGVSNLPLVNLFYDKKIDLTICDSRKKEDLLDMLEKIKGKSIRLRLGEDYLKNLDVDVIFRTPGLKFYKEELIDARERGIVVTSEMEVFFDLCPCKIVAITGSDGKTTTTTIISEMLKAEGKRVFLGGNIGSPLLPKIEAIEEDDVAVVELSSFQLISMRKGPDIAVITNISPNHLDIHKDMAEYIDAKKNIISHQNAFSLAVLNEDNETTKRLETYVRGRKRFFSRKNELKNGAYINDHGNIYMSVNGDKTYIMNKKDIKLPGNHNIENYLAAISALWGYVKPCNMIKVAKNFGGVEHRIEFVREVNKVKYYNDSIASSPTRVIRGILSLYDKKIILISGGYDKKIPFDELGPVVVDKVKLLILMGQTADKIYDSVVNSSHYDKGKPEIIKVKNMEEAVNIAYKSAKEGDIVSMSPACASFDAYRNFMDRGNHFKNLVNKLKEKD